MEESGKPKWSMLEARPTKVWGQGACLNFRKSKHGLKSDKWSSTCISNLSTCNKLLI